MPTLPLTGASARTISCRSKSTRIRSACAAAMPANASFTTLSGLLISFFIVVEVGVVMRSLPSSSVPLNDAHSASLDLPQQHAHARTIAQGRWPVACPVRRTLAQPYPSGRRERSPGKTHQHKCIIAHKFSFVASSTSFQCQSRQFSAFWTNHAGDASPSATSWPPHCQQARRQFHRTGIFRRTGVERHDGQTGVTLGHGCLKRSEVVECRGKMGFSDPPQPRHAASCRCWWRGRPGCRSRRRCRTQSGRWCGQPSPPSLRRAVASARRA